MANLAWRIWLVKNEQYRRRRQTRLQEISKADGEEKDLRSTSNEFELLNLAGDVATNERSDLASCWIWRPTPLFLVDRRRTSYARGVRVTNLASDAIISCRPVKLRERTREGDRHRCFLSTGEGQATREECLADWRSYARWWGKEWECRIWEERRREIERSSILEERVRGGGERGRGLFLRNCWVRELKRGTLDGFLFF